MNIFESITKIMDEGYAIGKDKKNPQQGYLYRGIDQVMNVFQPLLAKYKVFLVPEVLEQTREERTTSKGALLIYSIVKMKYTFYAEDGSYVYAVVIGEGMDSGDKSTNKAMSVAMKYAMFQVFCIPTEEMHDSEEDSPEPTPKKAPPVQAEVEKIRENPITKANVDALRLAAESKGIDEAKILARYGKTDLAELTQSEWMSAMRSVDKTVKK